MKALKKYLNRQKVTINFLLGKPKRTFTPGTFHKLRIELKKLNAFLDLINYCSKDFRRKKIFKPFKQIFKQAGKVRELQLQEAMLKKHFPDNSIPEYKAYFRKSRLVETGIFFSMIDPKMVNRLNKRFVEIESFLPKIKSKTAKAYLDKEIEKIINLINKSPLQKGNLHELRKRLKTLNNNRSSLSLEENKVLNFKKNNLPRLLGDWHDLQVMIDHLNKGLNLVGINPKEVSHLEKLKSKISVESERILIQLNKAISDSEFIEKTTKP